MMMLSRNDAKRSADFCRLLARLYRAEVDAPLLQALKGLRLPEAEDTALTEGYETMRQWLANCGDDALDVLAVDYAAVFLAAGSADGAGAIPCESVYTSPRHIFMQEAWEQVCALYAEKGLGKGEGHADLPEDHLAIELEFMAWLMEHDSPQVQKSFLDSHLLNWLSGLVADIEKYSKTDFYKAVGKITLAYLTLAQEQLNALAEGTVSYARSFSLRVERMDNVFARLQDHYRIFAPRRFPKRGPKGTDLIRYGEISSLAEIVYKEKSHFSAKEVFYPISQTMFQFNGDVCIPKELEDTRDILLIARPCDLNAILRLDNIFLHNGQSDVYYSRMRSKLKLVLLECTEGFDNCFCVSMGTNIPRDYSAALRIDDICALMEICDEDLLPYFTDEVAIDFAPGFVRENQRRATLPDLDREQLGEICALEYWNQFDNTCIACGGCNTVCPTCSCFDTVDIIYDETSLDGERRRVWSSCMLRDFTQTAGGGMARKTQGANMRFKLLHKVYDYRRRFGGSAHMCVGCGRCIDRCPKGIDYLDVVNGLTEVLNSGKEAQ